MAPCLSEVKAILGQFLSQNGPQWPKLAFKARACQNARIGPRGHFATKIDPTVPSLQKNLRRLLQKLLVSTLTWAIYFLESMCHHRDMHQSWLGSRGLGNLEIRPQIFKVHFFSNQPHSPATNWKIKSEVIFGFYAPKKP